MNKTMVVAGLVLLVGGIAAAVWVGPMYQESVMVAMFESIKRGNQIRMMADIGRYGGIGVSAIGVVLFLVGLLKKEEATTNVSKDV